MAFSHVVGFRWSGSGESLNYSKTLEASQEQRVSESCAGEATTAINCTIDVSALKSLYIVSDKDVLLETNSASSPTDSLSLLAGIPYVWFNGAYWTNEIGADVTSIHITNATAGAAQVEVRFIQDATP